MPTLSIGAVLSQSVTVLKANFLAFFLIGALMSALSDVTLMMLGMGALVDGKATPQQVITNAGGALPVLGAILVSTLPFYAFGLGTISYGAVRYMHGNPATVGECLMRGARSLPSLLLVALLSWIGVTIGMAFFVIPGAILLTLWYLAIQVVMVEGLGIFSSLNRSAALTKGQRFTLFGLLVILLGISLLIGLIVSVAIFPLSLIGLDMVANMVISGILMAFTAVVAAVVYTILREEKDGLRRGDLANV
ncbi:hypothetical protein HH303_06605 [Rhodospirillaceae bacterium KN72]|uniref:DUF7847 domain-containing protein n=1 Tax=Pacificispira spongiicola TaxID=2729598 RepID=A0A7Y0HGA1_9PROT|nr:hypothetical protein [Pacificispira spongiicola]NMM44139.1 hypothetical protein [Pacificispira spongiicola]